MAWSRWKGSTASAQSLLSMTARYDIERVSHSCKRSRWAGWDAPPHFSYYAIAPFLSFFTHRYGATCPRASPTCQHELWFCTLLPRPGQARIDKFASAAWASPLFPPFPHCSCCAASHLWQWCCCCWMQSRCQFHNTALHLWRRGERITNQSRHRPSWLPPINFKCTQPSLNIASRWCARERLRVFVRLQDARAIGEEKNNIKQGKDKIKTKKTTSDAWQNIFLTHT